jgi:hypothetical protein
MQLFVLFVFQSTPTVFSASKLNLLCLAYRRIKNYVRETRE